MRLIDCRHTGPLRQRLRFLPLLFPGLALAGFLLSSLHAQEYVPQADEHFPRIRYADAQESLNDRCPVRLAKLNLKMDPVYVNGRPVGFC